MLRQLYPFQNGGSSPWLTAGCAIIAVAGLAHCGPAASTTGTTPSHSISGNRPPVVKGAKILPDPIVLTEPVTIYIDADDPEREAVSFRYQWFVNGAALPGQTGPSLFPDLLRRGQVVSVEIVPSDGTHEGEPYRTAAVTVGNTPPRVVSVSLIPQIAQSGDRLQAQVEASDPDHDRVDLTYRWFKNNVVIKEGEEPFLDTKGFLARDTIVVEVTAKDPSVVGNSTRSNQLVLENSLPSIVSTPPTPGTSDRFEYAVKAIDPDGDHLSYQLETAPPGMMIGEESGRISWQIPPDKQGIFHVKIVAKDGHGGAAVQEFDLTLSASVPTNPEGA